MPINPTDFFDLVGVALIFISLLFGFANGLLRELSTILAFLVALLTVFWFGPSFETWVNEQFSNFSYAYPLFLLLFFILSLIVAGSALNMITKGLRDFTHGPIDRFLGALFGLLRALLLLAVAVIGFTYFQGDEGQPPEWLAESRLYPVGAGAANLVKEIFPEDSFMKDLEFEN